MDYNIGDHAVPASKWVLFSYTFYPQLTNKKVYKKLIALTIAKGKLCTNIHFMYKDEPEKYTEASERSKHKQGTNLWQKRKT